MNVPLVSVVMPVYNGQKYISESIESILLQVFSDFELIIIDDGSTDNTYSIIEQYAKKDSRIHSYRNSDNLGIAASLNIGLKLARSSLIARMDADDIAYPHRLTCQYALMQSHPDVAICGSALRVYEQPSNVWRPPVTHEEISTRLLFECSLCHPTIIYRKEIILDRLGGYQAEFNNCEDYELWQRASQLSSIKFANISEPLLSYRIHPSVNRKAYKTKQQELANRVRRKQLNRLGLDPSDIEFRCHEALSSPRTVAFDITNLVDCLNWITKLELANQKNPVFSPNILRHELNQRWLNLCLQVSYQSPATILHYLKWRNSYNIFENIYQMTRMMWRSRKYWLLNNG